MLSCLQLLGLSSQEVLSLEGGVGVGGMDTYTDYSSLCDRAEVEGVYLG